MNDQTARLLALADHCATGPTSDDVARVKYEHEYKPLGEYIAAKLSDVYDLPAGLTLEWESCPTPRPLVNPLDAATLRQLGLADDLFDVTPPAEKTGGA